MIKVLIKKAVYDAAEVMGEGIVNELIEKMGYQKAGAAIKSFLKEVSGRNARHIKVNVGGASVRAMAAKKAAVVFTNLDHKLIVGGDGFGGCFIADIEDVFMQFGLFSEEEEFDAICKEILHFVKGEGFKNPRIIGFKDEISLFQDQDDGFEWEWADSFTIPSTIFKI